MAECQKESLIVGLRQKTPNPTYDLTQEALNCAETMIKAKKYGRQSRRQKPLKEGASMKKIFLLLAVCALITNCAAMQDPNKYNTQRGAAVGAATGAIAGQAIGHNTASTLIGAAVGTVAGGLIGNAADQANQQPPPQQNQTQYNQTPTIAPECQKYIGNTGAVDSCMRGVNARRAEEDARLADEAYRAGYGNK